MWPHHATIMIRKGIENVRADHWSRNVSMKWKSSRGLFSLLTSSDKSSFKCFSRADVAVKCRRHCGAGLLSHCTQDSAAVSRHLAGLSAKRRYVFPVVLVHFIYLTEMKLLWISSSPWLLCFAAGCSLSCTRQQGCWIDQRLQWWGQWSASRRERMRQGWNMAFSLRRI